MVASTSSTRTKKPTGKKVPRPRRKSKPVKVAAKKKNLNPSEIYSKMSTFYKDHKKTIPLSTHILVIGGVIVFILFIWVIVKAIIGDGDDETAKKDNTKNGNPANKTTDQNKTFKIFLTSPDTSAGLGVMFGMGVLFFLLIASVYWTHHSNKKGKALLQTVTEEFGNIMATSNKKISDIEQKLAKPAEEE
jgi:hypothetical protein